MNQIKQSMADMCKIEAKRALSRIYDGNPPAHEVETVAASVYKKTTGEDMPQQQVIAGGINTPALKSYIERIERLEEDKAGLTADIRDVYTEAKSNGFDAKTMRSIVKIRKLKAAERVEQEYMLDIYKRALNMQLELEV